MADNNTNNKITTQPVKRVPNPTGKGGFGDHPENASPGGWKPEFTFSYQYKRFLNMSVDEFKEWQTKTKDKEKTMVEELAYVAVFKARTEFKERQEVTNRTEGMPQQKTDITSGGKPIPLLTNLNVSNNDSNEEIIES